jgi:sugar lactone lactonase YvrE
MPLDSSMPEVRTLMNDLMFGESPRWRDGRFWVSDWVAHEVIAVDLEGKSEVVVRESSIPLCFDFLRMDAWLS